MSEVAFAVTRTRFGMVPEWVDEVVTDGTAMRLYVRLARKYANVARECHPSQRSLAEELGLSVATVENALRKLRSVGAIVVRRTDRGDGQFGRNEYWLPFDQPSPVRAGPDQGVPVDQPSNSRGGPALTGEGSITRPTKAPIQKTPDAAAPEQDVLDLPLPAVVEKTAEDTKVPTVNQRAVVLAQGHYERLGGMGNVPAFVKIIRKALESGARAGVEPRSVDARVGIALTYIADHNWTLTEEKLANALRGGPRPVRDPGANAKVYLPGGRELQV